MTSDRPVRLPPRGNAATICGGSYADAAGLGSFFRPQPTVEHAANKWARPCVNRAFFMDVHLGPRGLYGWCLNSRETPRVNNLREITTASARRCALGHAVAAMAGKEGDESHPVVAHAAVVAAENVGHADFKAAGDGLEGAGWQLLQASQRVWERWESGRGAFGAFFMMMSRSSTGPSAPCSRESLQADAALLQGTIQWKMVAS